MYRDSQESRDSSGQLALDLVPRPPADITARFVDYLRSEPSPNEVAQEIVLGYLGSFQARVAVISMVKPDASVRLIGGFGLSGQALESLGSCSLWDDLPAAQAIRHQHSHVMEFDPLAQSHVHEYRRRPLVAVPLMTTVSVVGSLCVGFADHADSRPLAAATLEALADVYVLYLLANMTKDVGPILPSDDSAATVPDAPEAPEALSTRQLAILELLAEGMTYDQIAARIGYSHSTVRMELMQVYRAFGVSSRREAVSVGITRGLVPLEVSATDSVITPVSTPRRT